MSSVAAFSLFILSQPHRRPHPLLFLPPPLVLQIPRLQPLQLLRDLLALVRDAMRLLRLRPEVGHRESAVQVRAEVVHDADGEENVHAELEALVVGAEESWEWRTLATSRLGPPMLVCRERVVRGGCGIDARKAVVD